RVPSPISRPISSMCATRRGAATRQVWAGRRPRATSTCANIGAGPIPSALSPMSSRSIANGVRICQPKTPETCSARWAGTVASWRRIQGAAAMTTNLNATHDPARRAWLASANAPDTDFPIQNLPFGRFTAAGRTRGGVALGDAIIDLAALLETGLLDGPAAQAARAAEG